MSKDIKTRLAKEILDFKWPEPTTDVMRGWNLALDSLVEYKLTNDIEKVIRCKDCKHRYVGGYTTQYYVCDFMDAELKDEGYCSYGERKDG